MKIELETKKMASMLKELSLGGIFGSTILSVNERGGIDVWVANKGNLVLLNGAYDENFFNLVEGEGEVLIEELKKTINWISQRSEQDVVELETTGDSMILSSGNRSVNIPLKVPEDSGDVTKRIWTHRDFNGFIGTGVKDDSPEEPKALYKSKVKVNSEEMKELLKDIEFTGVDVVALDFKEDGLYTAIGSKEKRQKCATSKITGDVEGEEVHCEISAFFKEVISIFSGKITIYAGEKLPLLIESENEGRKLVCMLTPFIERKAEKGDTVKKGGRKKPVAKKEEITEEKELDEILSEDDVGDDDLEPIE